MPHYHVRTKKGSIELDTHDRAEAVALWRRLPNGASVQEYTPRGWVKIDPMAAPDLTPNRALIRHKLESLAWEKTPSARRGGSGARREVLLDTTDGTGMVPLSELTDYQLRRYIGPGALEEAGDMRKNGKGIYSGTAAQEDDYVIHKQGGRFHHGGGTYYIDRIGRGGTHTQIGRAVGCKTLSEAREVIRKDAHTRGIKAGVVFEQRGDELAQIGHTNAAHEKNPMRKNSRRPTDTRGLSEQPDLLQWLIEGEAESMELPNYKDAEVTPEVINVAALYDSALASTLEEAVRRFPPKNGATADDLWNANGPYLVLMTLRGEGVGIWDGDWDDFYSDTDAVGDFIESRMRSFASGSGSGRLTEAFMNAASETCGDPDYSPNASRSRAPADETAARELCLFIENESSLVGAPNSQGKAIEKNLLGHLRRGRFDIKLAEKAYMHLAETGAKKYCKDFGGTWSTMFSVQTRELVAHYFASTLLAEYKLGNKGS